MERTCNICGLTKPESEFRSLNKCIACRKAYLKEYTKNYYQENKEFYNERNKTWRKNNPEKSKEYIKRYLNKKDNRAITYKRNAAHSRANRKFLTEKENQRIAKDVQFKLKKRLRTRLYISIKSKGLIKHQSTFKLLGCSIFELKNHLESLFLPTMTWENYGDYWHIDHIIPCASFDLTKLEEQQKCFHYTNLQPLFATTQVIEGVTYIGNINKGDKILVVNENGEQHYL